MMGETNVGFVIIEASATPQLKLLGPWQQEGMYLYMYYTNRENTPTYLCKYQTRQCLWARLFHYLVI